MQLSSGRTQTRPGDLVPFIPAGREWTEELTWGIDNPYRKGLLTCARSETLKEKWLSNGWRTGTVPAQDFAEGHRKLVWNGAGRNIAAITNGSAVLIVTREATKAERAKFSHDRVPVEVRGGRMFLPQNGGKL